MSRAKILAFESKAPLGIVGHRSTSPHPRDRLPLLGLLLYVVLTYWYCTVQNTMLQRCCRLLFDPNLPTRLGSSGEMVDWARPTGTLQYVVLNVFTYHFLASRRYRRLLDLIISRPDIASSDWYYRETLLCFPFKDVNAYL
jgi:hypothetical protein